jgi:hypothetical protein
MLIPPVDKVLYYGFVMFTLFVVVNALAQPAYAYVDPGSGLLAFQVLGSTLAGMSFLLRKRIRQFFGRFARVRKGASSDRDPS